MIYTLLRFSSLVGLLTILYVYAFVPMGYLWISIDNYYNNDPDIVLYLKTAVLHIGWLVMSVYFVDRWCNKKLLPF